MARWSLAWRNPHVPPPGPRVLAAALVVAGEDCPAEVMEKWVPGAGYAITWQLVSQKPIRRWSPEARAKVRRSNLRRRMEKNFPLFAELFIAAELAARPEYFAGGDPTGRRST
ncbi:theronine dehydrogenase [Gluconacetobacter diazotrophicus]|uniref:Theronine dehydrogenase n=2 Tax=Gluconacetobacter diazotrophicus TaxID=33996 RepID=A0A7W4I8D1_GLUDI|nr:theronine dehydrogenase [Gluconacetobacter diazotrophicus]